MDNFYRYIVTRRFKGVAICGNVNLPYGTECHADGGMIMHGEEVICSMYSQNALDYFTQDDDGNAFLRRKLIDSILTSLQRDTRSDVWTKEDEARRDEKWAKVWEDRICQKYKRTDYDDFWLWSYDFYNAGISDLRYIANLVGAKEVK